MAKYTKADYQSWAEDFVSKGYRLHDTIDLCSELSRQGGPELTIAQGAKVFDIYEELWEEHNG